MGPDIGCTSLMLDRLSFCFSLAETRVVSSEISNRRKNIGEIMKRSSSFDEDLAKTLRTRRAVQGYLLGLTEGEDGLELEDALRNTIMRMGIKEFCLMTKIPMPNVMEFLKGKRHPKPETLEKYLRPFGLRVRLLLERAS